MLIFLYPDKFKKFTLENSYKKKSSEKSDSKKKKIINFFFFIINLKNFQNKNLNPSRNY